ncbi:hypothetical protein [Herbaspirillum lusitanum]|uniref:hypothetical protein n=1 Tax=Herbaspirillum lusitanum TaxID=213312 RepID=UPI0012F4935D|nr:hypothetical protein [Herbaspirillum lusitanum]
MTYADRQASRLHPACFPGVPSRFTKTRHRHRLLAAGKRTNTMPCTSETCATGRKGSRPPVIRFYVKQRIVAPHRKTYSPSQNEQEAQREGENTRMSVPAFASFCFNRFSLIDTTTSDYFQ